MADPSLFHNRLLWPIKPISGITYYHHHPAILPRAETDLYAKHIIILTVTDFIGLLSLLSDAAAALA